MRFVDVLFSEVGEGSGTPQTKVGKRSEAITTGDNRIPL